MERVLGDRPAAYWPLMETQGLTAFDWKGGNHGAIQGGVTLGQPSAPGLPGTAMGFDGTTGYIQTPYVQENVIAYTIEAWVRQTAAQGASTDKPLVADRGSAGSGLSITLGMPGYGSNQAGAVSIGVDSNGVFIGINSAASYADAAWHHVMGTWQGAAGQAVTPAQFGLLVDAVAIATTTTTAGSATAPLAGSGGTQIAYSSAWGYSGVQMAHVAIYRYRLTLNQAQAHFFGRPRDLIS